VSILPTNSIREGIVHKKMTLVPSDCCPWQTHNAWNVKILKTFELPAINAHLFLCSSCWRWGGDGDWLVGWWVERGDGNPAACVTLSHFCASLTNAAVHMLLTHTHAVSYTEESPIQLLLEPPTPDSPTPTLLWQSTHIGS